MWAWLFHMNVATRSPGLHPELRQGRGELFGALGDLEERGLLDAVGRDGEDLLVGVDELAVANDAADQQRRVLHRALHGLPSNTVGSMLQNPPARRLTRTARRARPAPEARSGAP